MKLTKKSCTRIVIYFQLSTVFLVQFTPGVTRAELPGVGRLLEQIERDTVPDAASAPGDMGNDLVASYQEYTKIKGELEPLEAAEKWLALIDAYWDLPFFSKYENEQSLMLEEGGTIRLNLHTIVEALPGPDAWPHLSSLVKQRPQADDKKAFQAAALKLLVYRLNSEFDLFEEELASLQRDAEKLPKELHDVIRQNVDGFRMMAISSIKHFQGDDVEGFRQLLEIKASQKQEPGMGSYQIEIADLVALAGEQVASELILKVFALPGVKISIPYGDETRALSKQLVMENIDILQGPQWGLVTSLDDVELYELMESRVPKILPDNNPYGLSIDIDTRFGGSVDYEQSNATGLYLLGLIARDDIGKAIDYVLQLEEQQLENLYLVQHLERYNSTIVLNKVGQFYQTIMEQHPELPLWDDYVSISFFVGNSEKAVRMLKVQAEKEGLSSKDRIEILQQLASVYLAEDQIEEAMSIYPRIMEEAVHGEASGDADRTMDSLIEIGKRILQLGKLLGKDDLTENGLALIHDCIEQQLKLEEPAERGLSGYRISHIVDTLIELERYEDALEIVRQQLVASLKTLQQRGDASRFYGYYEIQRQLTQLASIYAAAGRHQEVVTLLEDAPWWGAADLAELEASGRSPGSELLYSAAIGLFESGRKEAALKIVKTFLREDSGNDDLYRLLLKIEGGQCIPFLDSLHERDRFEERPLIWKATIQKELNQLAEAEETIRLALKVDPTDGEQRKGDRVLAYAVLAEILEARGNSKDAEFFRNVVKSVRVAEVGDDYFNAGLVSQSLGYYKQAEVLFADAYCIQWRLAERFHAAGKIDEAKKHYEIAFRRLPEQFGRVASFCFGCEGVFDREHSRSIAETILLELERTDSERPQVHFLLGQLREAQGKHAEAYQHFRTAVELDAKYLDAWESIYYLQGVVPIAQSERDAVGFRLLELDPLQRHVGITSDNIADLKGLWFVMDQNRQYYVCPPKSIMPLPASAAYLEVQKEDLNSFYGYSQMSYGRPYESPEKAVTESRLISALVELMEGRMFGYY